MTAEELFNMFFGSGFSSHQSNVFMRRNGRWHRPNEEDNSSHVSHYYYFFLVIILPIFIDILIKKL